MLRRVLRFGPELAVPDPNGAGSLVVVNRFPEYKIVNRLLWAVCKRLPGVPTFFPKPDLRRVTDPGPFMTLNNGVCDLAREGIDERQFRFGLRLSF